MDEARKQIFGLMAVAEEHRKAIKTAIEGLTAERAALAKERGALTQAAANVSGVAGDVRRAAAESIPAIQKAAGDAAGNAVRDSLVGAAETAATALGVAAKPVIGSLSGVVKAAGEAEGRLRSAGAWFAWKWVAVAAGGMAGACLLAWASILWQRHQVESLTEEKAALLGEVDELRAGVAALAKKGGRIKLSLCGPDTDRLCVEAASDQGGGQTNWRGSWNNAKSGQQFVIPKGY